MCQQFYKHIFIKNEFELSEIKNANELNKKSFIYSMTLEADHSETIKQKQE